MDEHLQRIRNQISARQITLNLPLKESDVRAFERRHKVELPAGYRAFLLTLGDGGSEAGPHGEELYRLGQYPPNDVPKPEYVHLPDIGRQFPFTATTVWEDHCDNCDNEKYQDDLSRLHYGNLCLVESGCGLYYHLIVTGPERGNVWQFAWDTGICPAGDKPEFLDWFENSLIG